MWRAFAPAFRGIVTRRRNSGVSASHDWKESSMKNGRLASLVMAVAGLAALGLLAENAHAQKTKGKTRPALTKQLMKGIVAPNCGDLKKALDAETTNWDDVALRAAVLNEAGHFLMDDGRCPD